MEVCLPTRGVSTSRIHPAAGTEPTRAHNGGGHLVVYTGGAPPPVTHQIHHVRSIPLPTPMARSSAEAMAACSGHCPRILVSAAQQVLLITHAIALLLIGREVYVHNQVSGGFGPRGSVVLQLPPVALSASFNSPVGNGEPVVVVGDKLASAAELSGQPTGDDSTSPGQEYLSTLSVVSGLVFLGGCLSCLILLFSPVTSLPYMRLCMIHRNNRVLAAEGDWQTPSLLTEIVPEIVMAILGAFVLGGFLLSEQQMCKYLAEHISLVLSLHAPTLDLAHSSLGIFSFESQSPTSKTSSVGSFISLLAATSLGGVAYGLLLPYFSSTMIAIVSFFTLCFAVSIPFFPFPATLDAFPSLPPSLVYFLPPCFLPCITLGAFFVACCCVKHFRKYRTVMCAEERGLSCLRIAVTISIFAFSAVGTLSFFSSLSRTPSAPVSVWLRTWHAVLARVQPILPRVSTCCGALCSLLLLLSILQMLLEYFSIRNNAVGVRLQGAFFSLFNLPAFVPTDAHGNPELSQVPGLSQCVPSPADGQAVQQVGGVSAPLLLLPGTPMPQHFRPSFTSSGLQSPKPCRPGGLTQLVPGFVRDWSSQRHGERQHADEGSTRSLMMVRSGAGVAPEGSAHCV
ncbi:hypothetical protein TGARI_259940 [Toxoplasma gondii ARI]|uniref:Transmembrane protein n=1 Tax=Toxoplasma gondii ARI TaxID=1074872 RepID=A0A139XS63_TOXGO|nr:hypothetical protein TGARI_259940 [Toxoplasma gondii ARI]